MVQTINMFALVCSFELQYMKFISIFREWDILRLPDDMSAEQPEEQSATFEMDSDFFIRRMMMKIA